MINIYKRAEQLIINTLFPCRKGNKRPKQIPEEYSMLIYEVIEEMLVKSNMANAVAYQENGVSYEWADSDIQCLKRYIPEMGLF